jgi:hypothetical protein
MSTPRETEPGAQRAALGDPGIYQARPGETVKVSGFRGMWKLSGYGQDRKGDYAAVLGGRGEHERIVTVDRIRSRSRSRASGRGSQ